jgi:hypothetical protein
MKPLTVKTEVLCYLVPPFLLPLLQKIKEKEKCSGREGRQILVAR